MKKQMSKRRAILTSGLALLLCISMLVGSTFAWFTDSVTSGRNVIAAGNLDVELYHSNTAVTNEKVDASVMLFKNLEGKPMLWEPGAVSYENLQIVNEGSLALNYAITMLAQNENFILDPSGARYGLSQVLKVGVVEGGVTASDREGVVNSVNAADWITLADFMRTGSLLPKDAGEYQETWGLVIYWEPGADDNRWNLNNGKTLSEGDALSVDLGVQLVASQQQFESDAFNSGYDANATFPEFSGAFRAVAEVAGKVDANNQLTEDVTVGDPAGRMYAVVPQGTALNPNTKHLILTVNTTDRSGNIEMTRGQVSRSLDVHISGIAQNNTVPATIDLGAVMPKDLKASSIQLYHVENGTPVQMSAVDTLSAHNQFVYTAATGEMSVSMATFSEVTAVVAVGDPWNGDRKYDWYNTTDDVFTITDEEQFAGFAAIVGGMAEGIAQDDFYGKTVKLGADLNLGGLNNQVWYPIGYHNSNGNYDKVSGGSITSNVSSFEGTFDGQNHTISDIYQNTWEMFGDYNSGYSGTPNHYKDGMGIFGFVYNGTIKNLTVNNFQSDGELCTTGVVAAYASGKSNFENIKIFNSNPRAYNVPNGGVVGYAYANEGATNEINFNNITVDTSNKITALWGSYDVGCGGILGRVNGATTVNMTNCVVGAVLDVFNDVCGNYQYYQYRYSGMLVGTVGGDSNPYSGPEKVNFSNVKVYIGNWADYYYCEFEKNSQGSYTEDFQFSRVEKSDINFNDETNMPDFANKPCKHEHTANEDKMGLYLPFNQLYTGYGWGSSPKLITEYGKEVDGVTVYRSFYSVTYMDATGKDVIAVEYATEGERTETKIWADKYKIEKTLSNVSNTQRFNGWVNVVSEKTSEIPAGNRNDVVLYASWTSPYTVRFVDQFGNVIYAETFTKNDTNISEPAVPEIEGFTGKWESYNLKNASSDITVKPIYTYQGQLNLTPIYENGILIYYRVDATKNLSGTVTVPGYVNGIPVAVVQDLCYGSNIFNVNFNLNTVIFEEGVERIESKSLSYTAALDTVKLPSTLEYIGSQVFSSALGSLYKDLTIEYAGTKEDWENKVTKESDWDKYLTSVTVKFIDGTTMTYKP